MAIEHGDFIASKLFHKQPRRRDRAYRQAMTPDTFHGFFSLKRKKISNIKDAVSSTLEFEMHKYPLFLVIMVSASITGCGASSPAQVLKNAIGNANEGKYSLVSESVTDGLKEIAVPEVSKVLWDQFTKNGTIADIEVISEKIRGEGAEVEFKVTFKDKTILKASETLIKQEGKWKLSTMRFVADAAIPDIDLK